MKTAGKKITFFVVGGVALVVGIALVLNYWPHVINIFKGISGMALALVGMFMLYLASQD